MIKQNLDALHKDSFNKVYQSFIKAYKKLPEYIREKNKHA